MYVEFLLKKTTYVNVCSNRTTLELFFALWRVFRGARRLSHLSLAFHFLTHIKYWQVSFTHCIYIQLLKFSSSKRYSRYNKKDDLSLSSLIARLFSCSQSRRAREETRHSLHSILFRSTHRQCVCTHTLLVLWLRFLPRITIAMVSLFTRVQSFMSLEFCALNATEQMTTMRLEN